MIHEDDRRILEDWPEAKLITAKKECVLGDHYHKIKTEKFLLVQGDIKYRLITDNYDIEDMLRYGQVLVVPPMVRHTFELSEGAQMIGLCSEVYNPNDDYR